MGGTDKRDLAAIPARFQLVEAGAPADQIVHLQQLDVATVEAE